MPVEVNPTEGGRVQITDLELNLQHPYYPDKLRIRTTMNFNDVVLIDVAGNRIVNEYSQLGADGFHKNQWHVFDINYAYDAGAPWAPNPNPISTIKIERFKPMPEWLGDPTINDFWAIEFVSNIEFGPQLPPPPPAEVWWDYTQNQDIDFAYNSGWYNGANPQSPQAGIIFISAA